MSQQLMRGGGGGGLATPTRKLRTIQHKEEWGQHTHTLCIRVTRMYAYQHQLGKGELTGRRTVRTVGNKAYYNVGSMM